MNVKVILIAESRVGQKLLERLLECHPRLRSERIPMRESENRFDTQSTARTILATKRIPVGVVMDADRDDPPEIRQFEYHSRDMMEAVLADVAHYRFWCVTYLKPCLEVLLFREPMLRQGVLPAVPSAEQLQRAQQEPRQVLAALFTRAGEPPYPEALLQWLQHVDLSPLWSTRELRPLEAFLLRQFETQPEDAPDGPV
jgi:hypothetical protein